MSNSTAVATVETKKTNIAVGSQGMLLQSFDELWRFAVCCRESGIAPKSYKTAEQIMVGLQTGMELGFTPMASLKAIAVINGTPAVWGDAMKALVERSPECEYVKEWTDGDGESLVAYCECKRTGRPEPTRQKFDYQDAKRAGLLGKDTYKAYPRRMFQMRARSFALRDQFADLLCGLAAAEEVQDYTHGTIEGELLPGDPAPQQGVQALLENMDADEGESPLEQPDAAPPWVTIELGDEQVAHAVYDEHCGPDSDADQATKEQCEAAWRRRKGIDPIQEANDLFSQPAKGKT